MDIYEGANRHQHRSRPPQRAGSDNTADAHNSVPGMSVRSVVWRVRSLERLLTCDAMPGVPPSTGMWTARTAWSSYRDVTVHFRVIRISGSKLIRLRKDAWTTFLPLRALPCLCQAKWSRINCRRAFHARTMYTLGLMQNSHE